MSSTAFPGTCWPARCAHSSTPRPARSSSSRRPRTGPRSTEPQGVHPVPARGWACHPKSAQNQRRRVRRKKESLVNRPLCSTLDCGRPARLHSRRKDGSPRFASDCTRCRQRKDRGADLQAPSPHCSQSGGEVLPDGRPLCTQHGLPMRPNGRNRHGTGSAFVCEVAYRERTHRRRIRRLEQSLYRLRHQEPSNDRRPHAAASEPQ